MSSFARSPRAQWRRLAACLAAAALASFVLLSGPPARFDNGRVALAADGDPFSVLLQTLAHEHGKVLVANQGAVVSEKDALQDVAGINDKINDIVAGGYIWLPTVPDWLRDDVLGCDKPDVACPKAGSDDGAFAGGAYLFYERLAGPPGSIATTKTGEWGPVLALTGYPPAPIVAGDPFAGGSHAVITRNDRGVKDVLYKAFVNGKFDEFATNSRSVWRDNDLITLVPKSKEIQTDPIGWDVYAYSSDGTQAGTGRDTLRGLDGAPLLTFNPAPTIEFQDAPGSSASTATAGSSAGTSTAPSLGTGTAWLPLLAILLAIVAVVVVLWFLFGRGRNASEPRTPTPNQPTPQPDPPPNPTPPPRPRECDDRDEEWREEKPAQTFVLPPPDAQVQISSDPTTAALEAWLFTFGFPRGAPIAAFVGLSDGEQESMIAGLPTAPSEIHWTIEFQLDDYRLACQRKWVCDAGSWVQTDEVRMLESGPDPYLGRYVLDGSALTDVDVRRIWAEARAVLVAAQAAVGAMKAYRADCG
jgi:hypothetical protein